MKTAEPKAAANKHDSKKSTSSFFNEDGVLVSDSQSDIHPFFNAAGSPQENRTPFFNSARIQTKLTVGKPNDKYEQEADTMADTVVQKLSQPDSKTDNAVADSPSVQLKAAPSFIQRAPSAEEETEVQKAEETDETVQKKPVFESSEAPENSNTIQHLPDIQESDGETEETESEEEEQIQRKPIFESAAPPEEQNVVQRKADSNVGAGSELESNLSSSKGSGSALPDNTRSGMEDAFGADFSGVRVHTGSDAVQMNKDLGAQAFTHGNNIYFNEGKYQPESSSGQHLLAHELTHTIQQGGVSNHSPKIQKKRIDDYKQVVADIFEDQPGFGILKIPMQYWLCLSNRKWIDNFLAFLKEANFDHSALTDTQLAYMALLYHTMSKKFTGWSDGTFKMDNKDKANGLLEIYFKLPTTSSGKMSIVIMFSSANDNIMLETTTHVNTAAFHPLTAMSMVLPDTDIISYQSQFAYVLPDGAYKGYGANFILNYYLFTPKDPLKKQTIYYQETIKFQLANKQDLNIFFTGKFDVPPNKQINSKLSEFIEALPELFSLAQNLDSTFGGTHSDGADIETLVFGFVNKKRVVHSVQQLLEPSAIIFDKAQYFLIKVLKMLEGFNQQEVFIDKDNPPQNQTFNTVAEAKNSLKNQYSSGYIITEEYGKYIAYQMTTADLIWLAKSKRGQKSSTAPRYANIDISGIVDAGFYELPVPDSISLSDKLYCLQGAYMSYNEVVKKPAGNYNIVYRTMSGFYGALALSKEIASQIWSQADLNNRIRAKYSFVVQNTRVKADVISMVNLSDEKSIAINLIIDEKHYEGRKIFVEIYRKIKEVKSLNQVDVLEEEFGKLKGDTVQHFISNELLRPNSMNKDQELKQALKELRIPGSALNNYLANYAFAIVASKVEKKALEMMESMLSMLDRMANDDLYMKMMLMSFKSMTQKDKMDMASIFTESTAEAIMLLTILENDVSMNALLMGQPILNISLDTLAANVKKSRDEIKTAVNDRQDLHSNSSMRYELLFIVQQGEMGGMLRKYAYDVYGFNMDPTSFPPKEHVATSLFPTPLHEGGKAYTNLLEQLYINKAVSLTREFKTLKTIQTVAMVASVFSLARGAGMFAVSRAGLIAGTAKAVLLEALVTSVVAGVMLEGIQVAMGKKFSWADLGASIGEAFVMMLVFGWVNKLFKLPITKFTVNATLFIGYGVGRFYLANKRFPNGFEFNLIILESVLMITLLHIGTKLTDPIFRRIIKSSNLHPELRPIRKTFDKLIWEIAKESKSKNTNQARIKELGNQFMENVKQYKEFLEKNPGNFDKANVKAELAKIEILNQQWTEAKFLDATQLRKVAQTDAVFFYKPGEGATKALKAKYGEDAVEVDKETGFAKVTTPEGEFKLIPEKLAADAGKAAALGEKFTDIFGNHIRILDIGVYSFYEGFLPELQKYVVETNKGKWYNLGNNVYAGEIGGRRVIFILESATSTFNDALALEKQVRGGGMEYLSKTLTDRAYEGIKILKANQPGLTDVQVIEKLIEIGNKILKRVYPRDLNGGFLQPRPKSVSQYLEKLVIESRLGEIKDFRDTNNIKPYKQNEGKTGTIAMVEQGGKKYFGANSTLQDKAGNYIRKLPKAEVDVWIDRLIKAGKLKNKGEGEFLYHAEAEALINAYKAGVKFPETATLFVDRATCAPACKPNLGALLTELGIKKLYIYWVNSSETPSYIIYAH